MQSAKLFYLISQLPSPNQQIDDSSKNLNLYFQNQSQCKIKLYISELFSDNFQNIFNLINTYFSKIFNTQIHSSIPSQKLQSLSSESNLREVSFLNSHPNKVQPRKKLTYMEIEGEKKPFLTSEMLMQQISQSVKYIQGIYKNREEIKQYFTNLLSDPNLLSVDSKVQLKMEQKWFEIFFDSYSEDENIFDKHLNLKENIFILFMKYLKDCRCSFYSIFAMDLKYLPDTEQSDSSSNLDIPSSKQPPQQKLKKVDFNIEYDSLRLTIAISHLVLYLYYYFLEKHKSIYLTNLMFSVDQLKLIDIASVSHIDYIIQLYLSCSDSNIEEGESLEIFNPEISNYEQEIEQFENFIESISHIAEIDEDIMKLIPQFENLYGFLLAKQQTIDLCKQSTTKQATFEKYYSEVVKSSIVNLSIPNNKFIDNKDFNTFYLHPYISLNHLTFNMFISPSPVVKENLYKNNIDFFDKIYNLIYSQFNKIFQNNCFITSDSQKHQSSSSSSSSHSKNSSHIKNNMYSKSHKKPSNQQQCQTQQQKLELQKCLNLIQQTIIITKNSEQLFSKLTEQIHANIR